MNEELKPIHIERLKAFARELVSKMFDEGYTLDEGDIQEIAGGLNPFFIRGIEHAIETLEESFRED